jgi:hypothetical protein
LFAEARAFLAIQLGGVVALAKASQSGGEGSVVAVVARKVVSERGLLSERVRIEADGSCVALFALTDHCELDPLRGVYLDFAAKDTRQPAGEGAQAFASRDSFL